MDELIARIQSEGESSPADLLITVDAGRLWRAEQAGIFQAVDSAVLTERLPDNMRHPEGLWIGLSKRARVIVYNREAGLPTPLADYTDLADVLAFLNAALTIEATDKDSVAIINDLANDKVYVYNMAILAEGDTDIESVTLVGVIDLADADTPLAATHVSFA